MGVAFYVKSPNLIEDIGIVEEDWESKNGSAIYEYVEQKYEQTAYNCWVAAAFYVITLILSSITCYLNSKQVY
ncbi:RNASEK [Bugula neritina]|uniref:RNASEK n=1 Tax=Bugula neritina TaxID=10212 RepID=A0A7J7J1V6_BUGNE|nr:RNASEK [Bugula neritina]KAF6037453.1 RNASEK [Bugula neritina]